MNITRGKEEEKGKIHRTNHKKWLYQKQTWRQEAGYTSNNQRRDMICLGGKKETGHGHVTELVAHERFAIVEALVQRLGRGHGNLGKSQELSLREKERKRKSECGRWARRKGRGNAEAMVKARLPESIGFKDMKQEGDKRNTKPSKKAFLLSLLHTILFHLTCDLNEITAENAKIGLGFVIDPVPRRRRVSKDVFRDDGIVQRQVNVRLETGRRRRKRWRRRRH